MFNQRNRKILVVDDDADITAMLCLVLRSEGFDCEVTTCSQDIFQKARSYKPDVILLDVFLTGYDGRKLCKQFKFHPETRNIPVIMVSGHDSVSDSIMEYGANDFLLKPFKTEVLISKIKNQLTPITTSSAGSSTSVSVQPSV